MDITHSINFGSGFVIVAAPANFDSAEADTIFTKDRARASLANLTLVFKGDTAARLYKVYEQGKKGGKGVAFALPYKVNVCGSGVSPLNFDFMLVIGHSTTKWACDQVDVPAWNAQGPDWFEKQCQAYSFWHLYKNLSSGQAGKINFSDFKKTPYTITNLPNYTAVVSLSFQELMLLWNMKTMVKTIIKDSTNLTTTVTAASVPITGTEHIVIVVGRVANLVFEVSQVIIYLVLVGKFMNELKKNIMQDKKYKLCMREETLWLKMCAFLGLTFKSSIYGSNAPIGYGGKYKDATWMPSKIVMPKVGINILQSFTYSILDRPEDEQNNAKSFGYYDGLFSTFVSTMEGKYNAEVIISNGILSFEEKNSINVKGNYQLPNTSEEGYTFNLPAPFRTNLSELAPYYGVEFQIDDSDTNTLHRYRGTSAAVQVLSPFPIDKYSGWGQGQIVDLGSALAKRKEYITEVEQFFNVLLQIVHDIADVVIFPFNRIIKRINFLIKIINKICKLFGIGGVGLVPLINNPINMNGIVQRIGWMELSNDSFSIPKTFIGTDIGGDWELHPQTEANMSGISLFNDFHSKNLATRGNQWLIYNNNKTKFCCSDYQQIYLKNIFTTPDGKVGKFDSMKWTLAKETAKDVQYRIQETYLSGLSEKLIVDGTP